MNTSLYNYQMVVVLNPRLAAEEKAALVEKIGSTIGQEGVTVDKKEEWGNKDLAYSIKGFLKGNFWLFNLSGNNGFKINSVETFFNREVSILRYLLLKV